MCDLSTEVGADESCQRIFIARPFDQPSQLLFDGLIAPSLAAIPLTPIHASSCDLEYVVEQVASAIAGSDVVLAVLIGQNRNVYIEAGIAIALSKPLLLLAEKPQDCGMLIHKYPIILKENLEDLPRALIILTDSKSV